MTITNGYATLAEVKSWIPNIIEGTIVQFSDSSPNTTVLTNTGGATFGSIIADNVQISITSATGNYDGLYTIFNVNRGVSFDISTAFVNDDVPATFTTTTEFDGILEKLIEAICRQIDDHCRTRFYIANETRTYYPRDYQTAYIDDCVNIDEVKIDPNFDGSFSETLSSSDYITFPRNHLLDEKPIRKLQIHPFAGKCFPWLATDYASHTPNYYNTSFGYSGYGGYNQTRPISNRTGVLVDTVQVKGDFGYSLSIPPSVVATVLLAVQKYFRRKDVPHGTTGGGEFQQSIIDLFNRDKELSAMLNTIPKRHSLLSA
jgi:hypothetical protein